MRNASANFARILAPIFMKDIVRRWPKCREIYIYLFKCIGTFKLQLPPELPVSQLKNGKTIKTFSLKCSCLNRFHLEIYQNVQINQNSCVKINPKRSKNQKAWVHCRCCFNCDSALILKVLEMGFFGQRFVSFRYSLAFSSIGKIMQILFSYAKIRVCNMKVV